MITLDRPSQTSKDELPKALTEFVQESIESMDEKKLRALKRSSEKIMRKAKRRAASDAARPAARKIRQSGSEAL